jgi:hypothetical protein
MSCSLLQQLSSDIIMQINGVYLVEYSIGENILFVQGEMNDTIFMSCNDMRIIDIDFRIVRSFGINDVSLFSDIEIADLRV